ncbi:lon2 [Symbiodinium sp. CCMP2592]|nr:lon2 [Symbiodinium sp. CCMP2592]
MHPPKGGYSAEGSGTGSPEIALSFLMFAQFFPLAWLRKASGPYSFETEEAEKRQLASLLDIRVGQLKFANAKQLKAHFRHSGPELALPRQVILVVHTDLRTLTASADILLHLGAKPKKTHWLEPSSLSAALLLTTSPLHNNMGFLEQLDLRATNVRHAPLLVQAICPACGLNQAFSGTPPAGASWRCNNCRGDPEHCRLVRRAVAAYRSGADHKTHRAQTALESMLLSAIKRGHAEASALCAGALAPLQSPTFVDAALRGRRAGILATILSFSSTASLSSSLRAVETHWLNAGRDFGRIRGQLRAARSSFCLNPADEAVSQQLGRLLRLPPLRLPRPAVETVRSFIFCRDPSEMMRDTLLLLGLTEGMYIRS